MVETEYLLIGFIHKLSLTYRVKSWFRSCIRLSIRHSLIRLVLIRELSYRGVLIVRGGSVTNNILLRSWRGPGRARCSTCFRYFNLKRKQNCRLSGQGRWLSTPEVEAWTGQKQPIWGGISLESSVQIFFRAFSWIRPRYAKSPSIAIVIYLNQLAEEIIQRAQEGLRTLFAKIRDRQYGDGFHDKTQPANEEVYCMVQYRIKP